MEVSGQPHAPAVLPLWKETPGTRGIEDWVVSRAGMDVVFNDDFSLKVLANLNKLFCFC